MTALDELFRLTPEPPFLRMSVAEINLHLHNALQAESAPKPSIALAVSDFLLSQRGFRLLDLLRGPCSYLLFRLMSVPQRCDYHVAYWALTGDVASVRYVLDVAVGKHRATLSDRIAASWAVDRLSAQSPAWRAAAAAAAGGGIP